MNLKIKKVPILKSALFLLLASSLYSCNLEPRQPQDTRERNFRYRQQVLNQDRSDDGTEIDDEIQNPTEPPSTEQETLFNEIADPRLSHKTLKLSEQEAQQLTLLSFQFPPPEEPLNDDSVEKPPAQVAEAVVPEEKPEEDPSETPSGGPTASADTPEEESDGTADKLPPTEEPESSDEDTNPAVAENPSTPEEKPQDDLHETPPTESAHAEPSADSEQPQKETSKNDDPSGQEEKPTTETPSKKTPPKWDIDSIDLVS